jgi:hypothetical protein
MKASPRLILALTLTAGLAAPAHLGALPETEAAAGRAVVQRYADTIIGVELVVTLKVSIGDRAMPPREQKREVNGTVIAATGLTVISLGEIDPRAAAGLAAQPNLRMEDPDFKEVKLRLADGTEIPARIVMKDADLDLAFVAPLPDIAAGRKFSFVNCDETAQPVVLGTYFDVSRTPKLQQRVPLVRDINVIGMIEKPRRFILATGYTPGCPVFDAAGRILGINVRYIAGGQQAGFVILPAADVAEIAKQAGAVKIESEPAPVTAEKPSEPAKTP